jgi:membrane associated rhomboid family serine protease
MEWRSREGYADGASRRRKGVPLATLGLMVTCTAVFFAAPEEMIDRLAVPLIFEQGLPHLILSTLTGTFFHQTAHELGVNMIFLIAAGFLAESRFGPWRFLAVIAAGGILSSLINLNIFISRLDGPHDMFAQLCLPPAGASGGIAALTGALIMESLHFGKAGVFPWRSRGGVRTLFPAGVVGLVSLFWALKWFAAVGGGLRGGDIAGFLGGLVLAAVLVCPDGGIPPAGSPLPSNGVNDWGRERIKGAQGGRDFMRERYAAGCRL